MLLGIVTLVVVLATLYVTWLLHLDSLEADWQPQACGPFEPTKDADGSSIVVLQFVNVGRGSARQCTVRTERPLSGIRVACQPPGGKKSQVKPGELLAVEVRGVEGWESCMVVLELGCQTRAGRRLVQRFTAKILHGSKFRIEPTAH